MSEKLEKSAAPEEEDGENRFFSFIVGIFITIAIMVVFVLLFNH
jgi:hypothetical protein